MTGSANTTGRNPPSNQGAGYGILNFTSVNNARRIIPVEVETSSIALKADGNNSGVVYVGFDDDVTTSNGYPLRARESISFSLDVNEEGLFGVAGTAGDGIRWIAVE